MTPQNQIQPAKYCSHHMGFSRNHEGQWIVAKGGKTRRWICCACVEAKASKGKQ